MKLLRIVSCMLPSRRTEYVLSLVGLSSGLVGMRGAVSYGFRTTNKNTNRLHGAHDFVRHGVPHIRREGFV